MIDYGHITYPRHPYTGNLSEERRTHICTVLGEPGTRDARQTINLDEFTANSEHFDISSQHE
jgi:hypothetical protein